MSSGITAIEHLKDGEGLWTHLCGKGKRIECCWPICGKNGEFLYTGVADWLYAVPGSWGTRKCSSCEVIWLDPQPVAKEIPKLYSSYCTHDASPIADPDVSFNRKYRNVRLCDSATQSTHRKS